MGTFAKTLFPGLRVGYLVADQVIKADNQKLKLVNEISKVKSFLTVNTSPITQAIVASFIIENNYSLATMNAKKIVFICHPQ